MQRAREAREETAEPHRWSGLCASLPLRTSRRVTLVFRPRGHAFWGGRTIGRCGDGKSGSGIDAAAVDALCVDLRFVGDGC